MPTQREKIEKWSILYHILKFYVDFCFKFYFRTSVSGTGKIPKDKPVIFAPNHQNALIDALGLLTVKRDWQPVFLARADIFEKPIINKILTFLKILPVYRIRDGYENLHKNDDVFNKTVDVLKNRNGLVIMPEGSHGDKKSLRQLKKGIARIAFQTEDEHDGNLNIYIVPVGIDYTNYQEVGSKMHIRFGNPIIVKPMLYMYKKNPAKAYNFMLKQLENELKSEMIHIENNRYYDAYRVILDTFTAVYNKKMGLKHNHENEVTTQILIIEKLNLYKEREFDNFLLLIADALEYNMLLTRRKIKPKTFPITIAQKWSLTLSLILLIVSFPVFLYSLVNNMIPIGITQGVSSRLKDKQFVSSVRYSLGIFLLPIFHILQTMVFALLINNLALTIVYFISLPLSVLLFFEWKILYRLSSMRLKEILYSVFSPQKLKRPKELHNDLNNQLWKVINLRDDEEYMSGSLS